MTSISDYYATQEPIYLAEILQLKEQLRKFMSAHNKAEVGIQNFNPKFLLYPEDYAFVTRLYTILDAHLNDED